MTQSSPSLFLCRARTFARMTCRWHNHYATRTTTKQTIHGLAKVGNLGVSEINVTPNRDSSHDLHAPQKAASFRTATAPPYQFALCNYAFILWYPPLVMYHRDATQIVTLDWSARQGRGMRSWCQCYHSTGATEPQSHRAAGSRQQAATAHTVRARGALVELDGIPICGMHLIRRIRSRKNRLACHTLSTDPEGRLAGRGETMHLLSVSGVVV